MKICLHFLLTFIFLVLASSVKANWEYTSWGMTAEEIVKASNGTAIIAMEVEKKSGANFTEIATGKFSTGPYNFNVSFRSGLNGNALEIVRLSMDGSYNSANLSNALSSKYGIGDVFENKDELTRLSQTRIKKTRWHTASDTIVLVETYFKMQGQVIWDEVSIDYSKRQTDLRL